MIDNKYKIRTYKFDEYYSSEYSSKSVASLGEFQLDGRYILFYTPLKKFYISSKYVKLHLKAELKE